MRNEYLVLGFLAISLALAPAVQAQQGESPSDMWNEAKLVMSYTLDTSLNPFDLEVEVRDGTAYITGTLPTAAERNRAAKLALSIDGIDQVENRIILDENVPHNQARYEDASYAVSDANMAAMVKAQLLWNRLTHALEIDVSVQNGVVTVSGPVSSEEEAREVVRIAGSTRLVEKVNNRLTVQKQ